MKSCNGNFRLPLYLTVAVGLAATACAEDPTATPVPHGDGLRFEVREAEGWHVRSRSGEDASTPTPSGVVTLRGQDPADTLFLHVQFEEGIACSHLGGEKSATRSTPINGEAEFYDSFGVLASTYRGDWDESACRPDYMYDVEITEASGWTAPAYYWPGSGNIRFFAYAPYRGAGITLTEATRAGTPRLGYTVAAEVAQQQDLMVAASDPMSGASSAAAPLTFEHVLTGVRFTTGDDMMAGRITKISLKGVYGSGSYAMGSDAWDGFGSAAEFSQVVEVAADGSPGQTITPVEATFLMIPQTLPEGAAIEVAFTDDLTGTSRTLTASIAGQTWPIGKTVTYRISTTSILQEAIFEVTAPSPFTYQGGSGVYTVDSRLVVSRPGDPTATLPLAWTAEFVEEDGAGGYRVIPKPDWIGEFTLSGDGAQTAASFGVSVTAQQETLLNYDGDLRQTAPVSGIYDLSTDGGQSPMRTANCYVVNAPGTYSLPLVYGNAIDAVKVPAAPHYNTSSYISNATGSYVLKNFVNHLGNAISDPYIYKNAGCTPDNAVLVWQDAKDLVTPASITLTDDDADGIKDHMRFTIDQANIRQGNAVLAVRDASNTIMWSWHIWVTTNRMDQNFITVTTDREHKVFTTPIGWCHDGSTGYAQRHALVRFRQNGSDNNCLITIHQEEFMLLMHGYALNFTYQFPMPFAPANPLTGLLKDCYDGQGQKISFTVNSGLGVGVDHLTYRIKNPTTMGYTFNYDSYRNLWANGTLWDGTGNAKTIYDPCPAGTTVSAPEIYVREDKSVIPTWQWTEDGSTITLTWTNNAMLVLNALNYYGAEVIVGNAKANFQSLFFLDYIAESGRDPYILFKINTIELSKSVMGVGKRFAQIIMESDD